MSAIWRQADCNQRECLPLIAGTQPPLPRRSLLLVGGVGDKPSSPLRFHLPNTVAGGGGGASYASTSYSGRDAMDGPTGASGRFGCNCILCLVARSPCACMR
jgi:hypothetical protein